MGLELFLRILEFFASFVGGALVSFVAFRVKMNSVDKRLDDQASELSRYRATAQKEAIAMESRLRDSIETLRVEIDERHEENKTRQRLMDRRQMFTLKLVADVARKIGVDSRVDDVVIGFLTKDNEESNA